MKFQLSDTVGNIVVRFPKGADVLKKYNIDYCCGGDRTFLDVCQTDKLDAPLIILELQEYFESLSSSSTDWNTAPIPELVNHILQAHHAYLYDILPELSLLTTKILRVHGGAHKELTDVYLTFHKLKTDMDMHLIKEETVQYPSIETYIKTNNIDDLTNAIGIILELQGEHTDVGNALKKLRKVTDNYKIPEGVCGTFVKTYELLEQLEQNTFTHIHLENNILFPRIIEKGNMN